MSFTLNRFYNQCPDCGAEIGPWHRTLGWLGTVILFVAYTGSFIISHATPLPFVILHKSVDWDWPEKHILPIVLAWALIFLGIIKLGRLHCPKCKVNFKILAKGEIKRYL
jgi:hypothetical protein